MDTNNTRAPFDITATNALGIADRMTVWAPTAEAAVAKFKAENPRWKVSAVRAATEITATEVSA